MSQGKGGDAGTGIPASPWACATLIQGDFGVERCFLGSGVALVPRKKKMDFELLGKSGLVLEFPLLPSRAVLSPRAVLEYLSLLTHRAWSLPVHTWSQAGLAPLSSAVGPRQGFRCCSCSFPSCLLPLTTCQI